MEAVAQWIKCWFTDLAVKSSSPVRGEDLFYRKRGSIAHRILLSSAHRPDMTEKDVKIASSIHPFSVEVNFYRQKLAPHFEMAASSREANGSYENVVLCKNGGKKTASLLKNMQ